jgi:hypothetical protein
VSNALLVYSVGNLVRDRDTSNLKDLASMELETKTLAQINAVRERISDMIAVLVGTQQELIKLLKENRELRDQLKEIGTLENVKLNQ